MKLREFDLDLPCADRDARREFRWQVRSTCALYERCFPGLATARSWKVLVQCVPEPTRLEPLDQLGVLCQEGRFDEGRFRASDAWGRKAMALEALHRGVLRVAQAEGWPVAPFEAARDRVVAKDFVNQWTWPKAVASPTRRWRAHLACNHDSGALRQDR